MIISCTVTLHFPPKFGVKADTPEHGGRSILANFRLYRPLYPLNVANISGLSLTPLMLATMEPVQIFLDWPRSLMRTSPTAWRLHLPILVRNCEYLLDDKHWWHHI